MQRWDANTMQTIGSKLFDKIHKRKKHSHHNHEIHFMARDRQWLPEGIQSLVNGTYEPRCLKRYYFSDEMVDQLYISDRIFQHILLRILKPTFKHVMNQNCYHLDGPTGVDNAKSVAFARRRRSHTRILRNTTLCWTLSAAENAAEFLQHYLTSSRNLSDDVRSLAA